MFRVNGWFIVRFDFVTVVVRGRGVSIEYRVVKRWFFVLLYVV